MSEEFITYAFSAGELSPTLYMRSDLEKYDLGVGLARNFFVDYRGGLSSRPGTHFDDFLKADTTAIRIHEFRFAPEVEDAYLMVFGDLYVRFMQNGGYITETAQNITDITQADPGVITITSHGYSDGDWVVLADIVGTTELNGRTLIVANSTTHTFTLQDIAGNDISTLTYGIYSSGGTAAKVYTVTTPYAAADLPALKIYQRQDEVSLTHVSYAPRTLTRTAAANWTLAIDAAASPLSQPTGVTLAASSAGSAGTMVQVTAVNADGEESLPSRGAIIENSVNYTATSGSLLITWTAVTDAKYYNIYRSLVKITGTEVTLGDDVGFLGRSYGPQFTDSNITPDFSKTPPQHRDPFEDGAIESITITAAGSLYAKADTVSVSGGGGSGFVGYPVINNAGEILSVVILDPGSGYSSPTVSFGTSTGSGATATATAGASSGNYPGTVAVFEQRKVYGGTLNFPMTVYGTKPGDFDNHDVSIASDPTDAYEYTIDDNEVAPVRHLVPLRDGLLVASASGGWVLRGVDDGAVSATSAKAPPLTYDGFSELEPIRIDNDILYTQDGGAIAKALVFNQFSTQLNVEEVSTLSNHLLKKYQIENWTYQPDPFKMVWAQRADGRLLSLTYVRDQKVFAWAQHATKGLIEDIATVREGSVYVVYMVVKRYINGRWTKFIEHFDQRDFTDVEDAWCLDSALELTQPTPAATLTPSAASGTGITLTASASVFASGDVGKVVRGGGGKAVITAFTSGTVVTADVLRDFTLTIPEDDDDTPQTIASGDWTMTTPVTTVSGLWHLEGETLKALTDGNVVENLTVSDGSITLTTAASKIILGIPFTCTGMTLPISRYQMRRLRVVGVGVRTNETRGLSFGDAEDSTYPMHDRTDEGWGEPTRLRSDMDTIRIGDDWDEDGSIWFKQTHPLPGTILGLILDTQVGDDKSDSRRNDAD